MATTKQQRALQKILENKGTSLSKILIEAGYSKGTAKNPQQVMRSKAFREVMEEAGIDDDTLANKLKEGLSAKKPFGKDAVIYDDFATQHKFLETALRLKGHDKAAPPTVAVIPIYGGLSGKPDEVQIPRHHLYSEDLQTQEAN